MLLSRSEMQYIEPLTITSLPVEVAMLVLFPKCEEQLLSFRPFPRVGGQKPSDCNSCPGHAYTQRTSFFDLQPSSERAFFVTPTKASRPEAVARIDWNSKRVRRTKDACSESTEA